MRGLEYNTQIQNVCNVAKRFFERGLLGEREALTPTSPEPPPQLKKDDDNGERKWGSTESQQVVMKMN